MDTIDMVAGEASGSHEGGGGIGFVMLPDSLRYVTRTAPGATMKRFRWLLCLLLGLAAGLVAVTPMHAQTGADAIRAVMEKSAVDWNRHDLEAFAACYKNSPDILFMGRKMSRGYDGMLASYRSTYSTPEKMGTLSFAEIEVQPLDARFATVTGKFHLERTAASGGSADGFYLLVFEKTSAGWKIVRDDSTTLTKPSR